MRGRDIELSVGKDRLGPMQAGFKAVGLGHVFLGQATAVRYRKTLAQSLAEARAAQCSWEQSAPYAGQHFQPARG